MNRKETTNFLGNLLKRERFSSPGKYWASEVSIDYGTTDMKRVDFIQFEPAGVIGGVSGIEKGIFICYEIKSCKADFKSGFGRNFIGERNYFVMPMATYKEVVNDFILHNVGVLVPIPQYADKHEEFENPTELSADTDWKLCVIKQSVPQLRKRSMTELLFCMLRSGNDIRTETFDLDWVIARLAKELKNCEDYYQKNGCGGNQIYAYKTALEIVKSGINVVD